MSTIKKNILLRINFISAMLHLSPPASYWKKFDSLLIKNMNGKRPRIKLNIIQKRKSEGGWGCPDFKRYHWSFILLPVEVVWFFFTVFRLQDFIFSGLSYRMCLLYLGHILSYTLHIFKKIQTLFSSITVWHTHTTIWHNWKLLSGGKPFVQPPWAIKYILTVNDTKGGNSILDFK